MSETVPGLAGSGLVLRAPKEFSQETAGLVGEGRGMCGRRGTWLVVVYGWWPVSGMGIVSQDLCLRTLTGSEVRVGQKQAQPSGHCLACVYSGVSSYASLGHSPIEVLEVTWNSVLPNYLDRGVPIMVCVCVCSTLLLTCSFLKRKEILGGGMG